MLTCNDPRIKEYIDGLVKQKEIYNRMMELSLEEQKLLALKPLNLAKIVDILKTKDDLINKIQSIENSNIGLKKYIETNSVESGTKEIINKYQGSIGILLEKLLNMDAGNEQILQEKLYSNTVCSVNRNHAIKAYGTYAK